MSRRPLPSASKRLRGTDRPDRANPDEPQLEPIEPDRPAWVTKAAAKEWDRQTRLLRSAGILTQIDGEMLGGLCVLLTERAEVIQQSRAEPTRHKRLMDLSQAIRLHLIELGMTPAARSKVKAVKAKPQAKLEKFRPRVIAGGAKA